MQGLFKKSTPDVPQTPAELSELIDLAIKAGTESGWFGDNGQEEAYRKRAVAELIVIEQRMHGDLEPHVAELEEALKDLVLRRQASPYDRDPPAASSESVAWYWDWRRTAAIILGSLLVGILLILFGAAVGWAIWIGLSAAAGLVILGPWRIANWARSAGVRLCRELRAFRHWLIHGRQDRRLAKQIWQMEEKITAARLRYFEHNQWVDQHLAVLMGHFDLQRRRAEQAAKIAGHTNVEEPEAETYAQILHNDGNHDERRED